MTDTTRPTCDYKACFKHLCDLILDKSTSDTLSLVAPLEKSTDREISETYVCDIITSYILTRTVNSKEGSDLAIPNRCNIGTDLLNDLEVFDGYQNNNSCTTLLYSIVKSPEWKYANHKLQGSVLYLRKILANPIHDIDALLNRQEYVRKVCASYIGHRQMLDNAFTTCSDNEHHMAWVYDATKHTSDDLHDMVYLNCWFLGWLDKSESVLTGYNLYRIIISPLVGIITPIVYVIVPYLIIRYKFKLVVPFTFYIKMLLKSMFAPIPLLSQNVDRVRRISLAISILFYFQSIFNNIELSKALYKVTRVLVTHMNGFARFVSSAKIILDHLYTPHLVVAKKSEFAFTLDEINDDTNYFNSDTNYISFSLFCNFGKQLCLYKTLNKDHYVDLIKMVYLTDCIRSIGMLTYEDPTSQSETRLMSYSTFDRNAENKPLLHIQALYHPCLLQRKFADIVKNDVVLGGQNACNMLLTGPNAGGKSTIIKSIMLAILLSQTLTVSNSQSTCLRPFKLISTQINIPDCKGSQSLFEAEMYRSKMNLDDLMSLHNNEMSIIAMDEIFSSTNPVEGVSGAYAIAKRLGTYSNAINIISTHYTYLSKLEKDTGTFVNYKMNVIQDASGQVTAYPYTLQRGISKQYVALDLLKQNGFDNSILDIAMDIKRSLLQKRKSKNTTKTIVATEMPTTVENTQEKEQPSVTLVKDTQDE